MRVCQVCNQELDKSMFYAAKTCKDGLTRQCKRCIAVKQQAYGQKNAQRISERNKQYREKNRDKLNAKDRAYHAANKERANANSRAYYEANKQEIIDYQKRYAEQNPDKVAEYKRRNKKTRPDVVKAEYERNKPAYFARAAERRATKTSRTPKWADKEVIAEYYKAVQTLNKYFGAGRFHVDHIVPLKHDLVSGLHTEANLQMLTGKENLSKNNHFWPHMSQT